jgi:hypothetical protein
MEHPTQTPGTDPFSAPIPGSSLTNSKDKPAPYETTPELNDAQAVTQSLWDRIREDEDVLDGVLDNMRDGLPLEDIAQVLLFEGFSQGKFNPDVMLNAIEPTIYLLAFLANYAEIPAVIFPEEDFDKDEEGDEALSRVMEAMESEDLEDLPGEVTVGGTTLQRPSAVPDSLLSTDQLPPRGEELEEGEV